MGDVIVLEVAVDDREQEGEAVYLDVELVPLDNEEDRDQEFREDGQQGEAEGGLAYVQTEEDPEQDEGQLEEGPGQGRQQWQPGEQEEDRPEEEPKHEGPGPALVLMPAVAPLDALRTLQLELEVQNEQAARAFRRLRLKMCQRRKSQLEVRSTIIRSIPAFWAKAIQNHPHLSPLMGHWDKAILGFMSNLEVKESRRLGDCCKIVLFFDKNPYFYNEQIVKEYVVGVTRYRAYDSTPVRWTHHYECKAHRLRHQNGGLNFFNWLSVHSFAGSGRIAEVISEDLWPNPLPYYLRSKAMRKEVMGGQRCLSWKDHSLRMKPHPCDTAAKALASVSRHSSEPPHVDVRSGGSMTLAGDGHAESGTRSRGSSVPLG
ncbi:testis-specific Y-encoded protein 2-like [Manis javanica]|uniref:testis-specific Y-encoded protein 2-like n=1 Tax=Manis javanica TaxID=9974 RepID=UPI003C6CE29F